VELSVSGLLAQATCISMKKHGPVTLLSTSFQVQGQEWVWASIWEEKAGLIPMAALGQGKMRTTLQRNQSPRQQRKERRGSQ